jgi:hypothetical protein
MGEADHRDLLLSRKKEGAKKWRPRKLKPFGQQRMIFCEV